MIGEITHLARSGRVIVSLSDKVEEGQILYDAEGTKIAKVAELIGPVSSPWASATPLTNSIKRYTGKSVFTGGRTANSKRRKT